jgi:hypothetical protein
MGSRFEQVEFSAVIFDHRLAILVHKGEDPKLPYQTLVVRQSAKLLQRVFPLGTFYFISCRRGKGGEVDILLYLLQEVKL